MAVARVNERLIRQLLDGLRLDAVAAPHTFRLLDARISDDDRSFTYTFGPPDVSILVEPLRDGPCLAQTRCFNVTLHQPDGAPPATRAVAALLDHVVACIRQAEPEAVRWSRTPTLFLIPGTITHDPGDLSIRAVELLRDVPTIVVEEDKTRDTRELLAAHQIAIEGKRILEVPSERVVDLGPDSVFVDVIDRMLAEDEDACLFGATEGLPGFCDPGKALIVAAAVRNGQVRVQSVPGPSALAMLLMRLPFDIDAFTFVGAPHDPEPALRRSFVRQCHLPAVAFVTYNAAQVIARTIDSCLPLGAEVLVASDLASRDEWLVSFRPDQPRPPLRLTEHSRLVLVVRHFESPTSRQRLRFAAARLIARLALLRE